MNPELCWFEVGIALKIPTRLRDKLTNFRLYFRTSRSQW